LTIRRAFPLVWYPGFMVVTPSFTQLSITVSNQSLKNCGPIIDVGFVKLMSDSLCRNWVFRMNIHFCCPVTCAVVVVWFFEIKFLNVRRSLSVNVDFFPLFLFADVVFPWFVYADITLETVALDTRNNVAHLPQIKGKKSKAVPVTGREGPWGL
jgi:hypothetical protein